VVIQIIIKTKTSIRKIFSLRVGGGEGLEYSCLSIIFLYGVLALHHLHLNA